MLATTAPAIIRTLAGYLVAWLLSLKLAGPILDALGQAHASETDRQRLISFAVLVLGTLYYAAIRLLEQRWPALTVLLGSTKQPTSYADAADGTPVITSLPAGVIDPTEDLNTGYDAAPSTGSHATPSLSLPAGSAPDALGAGVTR